MFGTKMVRVGNFDALEPIKYHRSSGPILRRADEEPGSNLNVLDTQVIRLGQQKMLEGPEEGGGTVRGALVLLCSSSWSCNGAAMGETTSGHQKWLCMLSWQPCLLRGAGLCLCRSHWSCRLAMPWLSCVCFSGHMPGRLMIHNFLIPGSSQVQQMLLLPLLLNKVGSREKEICQYCFSAGTEIKTVCGILSNSKPCSKSPFCVACLWKLRLCPCIS